MFPDDPTENTVLSRFVLGELETGHAIVPELWPFEIANILAKAIRKNRIEEAQAADFVSKLRRLRISIEPSRFWSNASLYSLAAGSNLSAYDAAYLDLAIRRRIPIATADRRLSFDAEVRSVATVSVS